MPKDNPPRWITAREAFDYRWHAGAVTNFPAGEHLVKGDVADYAMAKGKATEGKADGSEARAPKGKTRRRKSKATAPVKSVKPAADAADLGQDARMGGADLAADDRAGAGQPLAHSAE